MAFPVVETTSIGSNTVAETTPDLTLPSGITPGDLLIMLLSVDGNPGITWPAGWTQLFYGAQGGNELGIAYREADGTEGSTVVPTLDSSQGYAWIGYRISGHVGVATQPPEISTIANGVSQNPDPNSLTPTGGAKDYLWIAACSMDGGDTADAFPANYIGTLTEGPGLEAGIASCHRLLNAASEDPGAFTKSDVEDWVAVTISVHPFVGGVTLEDERRFVAGVWEPRAGTDEARKRRAMAGIYPGPEIGVFQHPMKQLLDSGGVVGRKYI